MAQPAYHVLTHRGDALADVDAALAALAARGIAKDAAGLHKVLHVTRAEQTVVRVTRRDAPIAVELRNRGGWSEPGDIPLA